MFATVLLCAPAPPPPPPQMAEAAFEENQLRIYDVSGLRLEEHDYNLSEWGVRLTPMRLGDYDNDSDVYEEDAGGSEMLVDVVIDLLGPEFEYEGRRVSITTDGRLAVRGPAGLHERVVQLIAFLEEALNAQVELEIDVLSLPAGSAAVGTVLTDQEARALVDAAKGAGRYASHRVSVRGDRPAMLDLAENLPVVLDYDVEIAQGTAIHDPTVEMVSAGTRAFLLGSPARGGTHLAIALCRGERLAGDDVQLGLRFHAGLEKEGIQLIPSVQTLPRNQVLGSCVAFSTFLPNEGVLALRTKVALAGGQMDELVLLRRVSGGLPLRSVLELGPGGSSLVLADLGSVAPPHAAVAGTVLSPEYGPTHFSSQLADEPPVRAMLRRGDPDFVSDLVDTGQDYATMDFLGPWMVSRPYGGFDENAGHVKVEQDAMLAAFEELYAPTDLIELTVAVRGGDEAGGTPLLARLPVRPGSSAGLVLGIEGSSVVDYDVEVAQMSSVPDPRVEMELDGMALWVRATPTVGGDLSFEVRGAVHLKQGEALVSTGCSTYDALQQSRFRHLFVNERRVVPEGEGGWRMLVGDVARRGRNAGLAVEVTAARR